MRPPLKQNLSPQQSELLAKAMDALNSMEMERVQIHGGYPGFATNEISGYVLYVTLDHDEAPGLEVFAVEELIAWYQRACRFQEEKEGFDIVAAMYETQEDE
jgi:hypothetical protein